MKIEVGKYYYMGELNKVRHFGKVLSIDGEDVMLDCNCTQIKEPVYLSSMEQEWHLLSEEELALMKLKQ